MQALGIAPGTVFQNTYRIVRRIGAGGMGEVYEATHARLSGRYAVKILLREVAQNPEAFARFKREAEITSALRHPNIVQVVDFNMTADGAPYLVMEFLDGLDLATILAKGGPLPLPRVVRIARQIASGLAAAHNKGIVHRDLKPQNVFLVPVEGQDEDFAKVVDFGISKVRSATKNLTRDSAVMGTPQYMSPEQALGHVDEVDPRTDQFALAAMIYEMLTGQDAFTGENLLAVMYCVVHEQPRPLEGLTPWAHPAVEAVIGRAFAKRKTERYASILDFARALEAASARVPVPAEDAAGRKISLPDATVVDDEPPRPITEEQARALADKKPTTFRSTASELGGPADTDLRAARNRRIVLGASAGAVLAVVAGIAIGAGRSPGPAAGPPRPAPPALRAAVQPIVQPVAPPPAPSPPPPADTGAPSLALSPRATGEPPAPRAAGAEPPRSIARDRGKAGRGRARMVPSPGPGIVPPASPESARRAAPPKKPSEGLMRSNDL